MYENGRGRFLPAAPFLFAMLLRIRLSIRAKNGLLGQIFEQFFVRK